MLKIAGQNSYIHGGYELMEFAYVIQCLIKKTNIDLALVVRVDPAIDKLRDIEDVSITLSLRVNFWSTMGFLYKQALGCMGLVVKNK